jgi:DNA-binding NarL/FixJ family response regulator
MSAITIVLADDHAVLRQGLRRLLERARGYDVLGEAADGPSAIELAAQVQPDVLVVDLMMPGMSGLEVVRQVRQRAPRTRIVVLSMHADAPYVREALRTGAAAYILKEAPAAELLQAVMHASQGRQYLSAGVAQYRLSQPDDGDADDPYELLTESERAVLVLAAQGHTSAAIGARLGLSARTVETYRANVLHKLDIRNQTDLVRYAIKRGIIPLE